MLGLKGELYDVGIFSTLTQDFFGTRVDIKICSSALIL